MTFTFGSGEASQDLNVHRESPLRLVTCGGLNIVSLICIAAAAAKRLSAAEAKFAELLQQLISAQAKLAQAQALVESLCGNAAAIGGVGMNIGSLR